jgi:hypothetical protein
MAGASGRHDHITALRTVLRGHRRIRAVTQKPRSRHLLHRVVQDTHANRETFAFVKIFPNFIYANQVNKIQEHFITQRKICNGMNATNNYLFKYITL